MKAAAELAEDARTLADSTQHVPHPAEVTDLLGQLSAAQWSLTTVLEQLAGWHLRAEAGVHHDGNSSELELPADLTAAAQLVDAAEASKRTAELVDLAAETTGKVHWFDDVRDDGRPATTS